MTQTNALIEQLGLDKPEPSKDRIKYDRGMFISINNHKQGTDDLYASLKKQYQSLVFALTGKNVSKDEIKVTDKLPPYKKLILSIASKRIIVAAAIHSYDAYNKRTGRGSRYNFGGSNHLHLYVYNVANKLANHTGGVDEGIKHIKGVLYRHNKFAYATCNDNINIREVGIGKYQYNDIITPTTLYDYLALPKTNPSRDCIINYMAGTKDGGVLNPILYITQKENS